MFGQATRVLARRFSTTAARRSQEWQQEGVPGSNLPFSIHNRHKLTAMFIVFFSSGLSAPFLIIRRQLLLQAEQ